MDVIYDHNSWPPTGSPGRGCILKRPKKFKTERKYLKFLAEALDNAAKKEAMVSVGYGHSDWCPHLVSCGMNECCCRCERQIAQVKSDGSKKHLALRKSGGPYNPVLDEQRQYEAARRNGRNGMLNVLSLDTRPAVYENKNDE